MEISFNFAYTKLAITGTIVNQTCHFFLMESRFKIRIQSLLTNFKAVSNGTLFVEKR